MYKCIYVTDVWNYLDIIYQNRAEYNYVWQLLSIFLFILYTGSNSEDPDEMQHKVAFYQDLHCHLQGLKNIILYVLHTPYNTFSEWKGLTYSILSTDYWTEKFSKKAIKIDQVG